MLKNRCSVEDACGRLSDGEFSERLPLIVPGERLIMVKVVWGRWKRMEIDTLKRKYYLAKKSRKKSG